MIRTALTPLHALLALAVVAVWGTNFVVIKVALGHLPPLTFAALRFTFAFLPAALFIKRPAVPWKNLAAYGVLIGVGQFGLLYIAMRSLISPGLASLVVQMQVFFTIALAMRLSGERIRGYQIGALVLAAAGLAWLVAHTNAEVTPLGLTLVLFAALGWAGGNIVARATPGVNMLAFVVWASLFSIPPLFALALAVEGWPAVAGGIAQADASTWAAVLYQSVGNTLFGYAAWGFLLARYPAATISPLSLLVPVFGMAASAIFLGEPLSSWKLTAAVLVLSGLALNTLWPLVERRRAAGPGGLISGDPMPSRETVDAFVAHVMSEDHVGAIERYYAEDASMQENQGPPRIGRAVLMEGERRMLARWTSVKTELLGGPLIDGDAVAIRWRFTFTPAQGAPLVIEEVAWQAWAGDKIVRETFFYDPAQRGG